MFESLSKILRFDRYPLCRHLPDGDYPYTLSLEGYVSGSGSVTISGAGEEVVVVL